MRKPSVAPCDVFVLLRRDRYGSESLPLSSERIQWLTGFSGSFALVAVAAREAVLWTDSRYTIQARYEVDESQFTLSSYRQDALVEFLRSCSEISGTDGRSLRVGYDPWQLPIRLRRRLQSQLGADGSDWTPLSLLNGKETKPRELCPLHAEPVRCVVASASC